MSNDPASFRHTMMASALANIISVVPCHPMDTVKARLQASTGQHYRGIVHCAKETFREGGCRAFFRGMGAAVVVGTPGCCLYFGTYEAVKSGLGAQDTELAFFGHFSAGLLAEAASCVLFVPQDVIKERLQVQRPGAPSWAPPVYTGSWDALCTIQRTEGLRGLYKGYNATLASWGPFTALTFVFYEQAKKHFAEIEGVPMSDISAKSEVIASAGASSIACVITNPLDLAKLRLQTQRHLQSGEAPPEGHLTGLAHALRAAHAETGLRGLFRGAGARIAWLAPNTCILFTAFEECKKMVQRLD